MYMIIICILRKWSQVYTSWFLSTSSYLTRLKLYPHIYALISTVLIDAYNDLLRVPHWGVMQIYADWTSVSCHEELVNKNFAESSRQLYCRIKYH